MVNILRNSFFLNSIFRVFIRLLVQCTKSAKWIANKYRIYGVVTLNVLKVKFKIYAEADDFIANELYYNIPYEEEEFRLIKELALHANYFIDVGANTGIFSLFANRVKADLKVISFEPHPYNFARLKKNIALNNASVKSFDLAMGNKNTILNFTVPFNDSLATVSSVNESFTRNFHNIPFKTILVEQATLDDFFRTDQISRRDLIKIDVEYYEVEVLEGALMLMSKMKPTILIEVLNYKLLVEQFPGMKGNIREDHASSIVNLLISHGYFSYQLVTDGIKKISLLSESSKSARNFLFVHGLDFDYISYQDLVIKLSARE